MNNQKSVSRNNRNGVVENQLGLRERFGYGTKDRGLRDITTVTSIGKIGLDISDTTNCHQGGCSIEGQFCQSLRDTLEWTHIENQTNPYRYSTIQIVQTGQLLKYSDEITLQNLAAPNNPNFLGTCDYAEICTDNKAVFTFTNNLDDYRDEKWRILDSEGNAIAHTNDSTSNVNYGDTIMLQSVLSGWTLETCGLSDCNNGNELYNVSTREEIRNPMHNVQRWRIVSSTGASGAVRTGDDIKLLNLAGEKSWLNTCNSKSGCGTGQLYGVNTCIRGSDDASATTSEWRISTDIPTITVDQCKAVCLGDTQCESFDYNKVTSQCDIGYFAAGKDGVAELSSYPGQWDYYERTF
jgi:hypothetical protein